MNNSVTVNLSFKGWLSAAAFIFWGLTPIATVSAAELYGMPAARVEQSRGVDQSVNYQSLTKIGIWDERNYQLTASDLKYLSQNETELSAKIPAFFRVELRKMWPHLLTTGPVQYPRAAWQMFRLKYGGIKRNGKIWGPDFKANRVDVPVSGELQLNNILGANEITVEINPSNPDQVIAGSNNNGGQEMYYSQDGGDTWTIQGVLPNTCCDPTIDWSSDGSKAYVAALSGSLGVSFWSTEDGGVTWDNRVIITSGGSDKEFIHVDRSSASPYTDNVYVTYHNGNVMQIARSTDMGASFDVTDFPGEERGIGSDITTTSNGDIYNFYGAFNSEEIIMLKSTDGGDSYTSSVVDSTNASFDWPIPSMETRRAWIYVAADADRSGGIYDGSVYASWTDTNAPESSVPGNNHTQVKVAYSRDGGETWNFSFPHPTDDVLSVDRYNQWLTVDESGNVHVVFYDTRNSTNRSGVDLYYTISTDGAQTWNELTRISSETSANLTDGQEWGDYNGVSVVGEKVITVWTDNRDGPPNQKDVYTAQAENIGAMPNFTLSGDNLDTEVCTPDSFNINVEVGSIQEFSSPVTLSADGVPAGFLVNFSTNPVTPVGNSIATITAGGSVTSGDYSFDIVGNAAGVDNRALTVEVAAANGVPLAPALISPANGATDQGLNPTLTWSKAVGASSYTVVVSTDAAGNDVIETGTADGNSYTVSTPLATETTYYWRATANNICGVGGTSGTNSFTTGSILCSTTPFDIVDNSTESGNLEVSDTGVIESLNVSVNASHTWVGDVTLTLVHEDTNTSVVLMDRPGVPASTFGCDEDDINAEFTDSSSTPVETTCNDTPPAIGGMLQPEQPLAAFGGESISGSWRLEAADGAGGDPGVVNEWCLLPTLESTGVDTDGDGVADSADNCTLVVNTDQRDTDGDGYGNICDPDLNNDGIVGFADVNIWSSFFNTENDGDADFNGDGLVNFLDYAIIPGYFLQPPGPSGVAP